MLWVVKIQHNTDRERLEQADRDHPDERESIGEGLDYRPQQQ